MSAIVCPRCGANNVLGAVTCATCGNAIHGRTPETIQAGWLAFEAGAIAALWLLGGAFLGRAHPLGLPFAAFWGALAVTAFAPSPIFRQAGVGAGVVAVLCLLAALAAGKLGLAGAAKAQAIGRILLYAPVPLAFGLVGALVGERFKE